MTRKKVEKALDQYIITLKNLKKIPFKFMDTNQWSLLKYRAIELHNVYKESTWIEWRIDYLLMDLYIKLKFYEQQDYEIFECYDIYDKQKSNCIEKYLTYK